MASAPPNSVEKLAAEPPHTIGVVLSEAADFLFKALQGGGAAAAARLCPVLKKWAKEGRAYKGRSFTAADVDAAIKAFDAEKQPGSNSAALSRLPAATPEPAQSQAADSVVPEAAPGESVCPQKRQAIIKARLPNNSTWPTAAVAAAAVDAANSPGTRGALNDSVFTLTKGSTPIRSLFALVQKDVGAGGGDVTVTAADGVVLQAHSAVLCALSPVIKCKFDGRFGQTWSNALNAREFTAATVRAALCFAYLGEVGAPESELGALFALADFWELSLLKDALLAHMSEMRPIQALVSLATWDIEAVSAPELGNAIAACAAKGLLLAADSLTPAPREPMPAQPGREGPKKAEEEWARRAQASRSEWNLRNAPVWQFARELRDASTAWKPDEISRLRSSWVDGEGSLAGPLEQFFAKTLSSGTRDEVRVIMSLRELVPNNVALCIARRLVVTPGLIDEAGQLQPWVEWVCDSSFSFAKLWSLYCIIRNQFARTSSGGEAEAASADAPTVALPRLVPIILEEDAGTPVALPRLVENAFAMAFAGALEFSESAERWAALLEHDAIRAWPALDESLRIVSRFLDRSRAALGNLPPQGVLHVLRYATQSLPTAAVQLTGPEFLKSITGMYRSVDGSSDVSFVRESEHAGAATAGAANLVLRRRPRGGAGPKGSISIPMMWTGVPADMLRAAPFEWKIHRAGDDADVDLPFAVALDSATDPTNIVAPWWIYVNKVRKFVQCGSMRMSKEVFAKAEIVPLCAALVTWAKRCPSVQAGSVSGRLCELMRLVRDAGSSHRALLQLCNTVAKECSVGAVQEGLSAELETAPDADAHKQATVTAPRITQPQLQSPAPVESKLEPNASFCQEIATNRDPVMSPACPSHVSASEAGAKNEPPEKSPEVVLENSAAVPSPSRAPSRQQLPSDGKDCCRLAGATEQQSPMEMSEIAEGGTLPHLEHDLEDLLDTFDAQQATEPPMKARRIGEDATQSRQTLLKRLEIQDYLRTCPDHNASAILRNLLATRPDFRDLMSKELCSK